MLAPRRRAPAWLLLVLGLVLGLVLLGAAVVGAVVRRRGAGER